MHERRYIRLSEPEKAVDVNRLAVKSVRKEVEKSAGEKIIGTGFRVRLEVKCINCENKFETMSPCSNCPNCGFKPICGEANIVKIIGRPENAD